MNTTLTVRNIIGAFVGGVAGILTCYYASLTLMPFGCLIGVVLGFWHDKLFTDYRRYLAIAGHFLVGCKEKVTRWKDHTMSYLKMPGDHLRRLNAKIPRNWGIGRHVVRGIIWFISLPLLFVAWLRRHPMNRANTLTVLTVPVIFFALWKFGYLALALPGDNSILAQKDPPVWLGCVGIGLLVSTPFIILGPVLLLAMRGDGGMEGFYRQYSRYSRYGPIGWVIYELKNSLMMFAYAFIMMEIMLAGIVCLLGLIIATIAIIVTVVIPARVFWRCVQLPGHWFCFGMTVIATLVTWSSLRGHILNPAVAWTVALVNGIVAAIATEVLRRAYGWLVSKLGWLFELTHLNIWNDEPDATFNFLGRTLGKPVIQAFVSLWRIVRPHLPRVHLNPDSFWMPV